MRPFTRPAVVALGLLLAGNAHAQGLDMSGMVANELAFQQQFYGLVQNTVGQLYAQCQRWRAATEDYRSQCPQLASPFNAATIAQSNREASQAWDGYNQAWHQNSARTTAAIDRYGEQAILGQAPHVDPTTGQTYTVPNGYNHYWTDNHGQVWGTQTYTPPDYQSWYRPLYPSD